MSWYPQINGQYYKIDPTIDPVSGVVTGFDAVKVDGPGPADPGLISASGARGFSPADIIEMAMKQTERRGKQLDLPKELANVAQEFCQERRWHWRKKSLKFSLSPTISTYDLGTQPGMFGLTCERVAKNGVRLFVSDTEKYCLSPIFESNLQDDAREDDTQDRPVSYFFDGQDQFRVVKIPDAAYDVRVTMWVLPDCNTDWGDTVPLVPPHLHHILVKGLKTKIFQFTLGEGSVKYQAAIGEYQAAVLRAALNTDFAEGRITQWTSDECAIRST